MKNNIHNLKLLSFLLAAVMLLSALTACPLLDGVTSTTSVAGSKLTTTTTTAVTTSSEDKWLNYDSEHKDIDNNGTCDECGIDVVETLDFYNFNDLHGKLEDTDSQPGVDELTTYLEGRKDVDEHIIILSTGDMWQGSSESNVTKGALMTDWMNYLGFEAMTLGNHEYDWGSDYIRANAEIAEFPFLAINIYDNSTEERVDYCEPSVMIERGGCQIGLIGAIGDCYTSILSEMTKGIHFKVGDELTALVMAESERLREAGADIIVYMLHDGGSYSTVPDTSAYYDQMLSRDGYVDLVFEGHSHNYYTFEDEYGVPHLQGGGDNSKGMTHVEVDVNFANGNIEVNTTGYVDHSDCASLDGSPIVDSLMEKYWDEISVVYRELGYNSQYRSSSEIKSTVARLYYEAGVEKWGDEYDIVLAGGSINTRNPHHIKAGTVKYSNVQMILPFDNALYLCSISGSDLLDKFINSGYCVYSTVDAADVDPNSTYYIVADSWTALYAPACCTAIEQYDNETFARDFLAKYIEEGNWEQ